MALSTWLNHEFIKAIPKSDLHVHLDGSLRIQTLIELSQQQGLNLPSFSEAGLRETVFKERYQNLEEYLHGFKYTCAVLREPEALERVAYELAQDNFAEGVRYIEPRFAPQLCTTDQLDILGVLSAVDRGLSRAKAEINRLPGIVAGSEPPFDYGIIGCAMRKFDERFSPYYAALMSCHRYLPSKKIYPLASMELARALVNLRDKRGLPIVGFDLAGEEKGYPANAHRSAYEYAHKHFLNKTVHAGEAYGPSSIFQAITECHADRIGHGTYLFAHDLVDHLHAAEAKAYTRELIQYIGSRRITIEVCPTSNLQTQPSLGGLEQHPVGRMIQEKISLTLCTDNRLVSNTTVCEEIEKTVQAFQIAPRELKDIIIYGFKRSFSPLPYAEKRRYVRQIIDYYDTMERKFLGPVANENSS